MEHPHIKKAIIAIEPAARVESIAWDALRERFKPAVINARPAHVKGINSVSKKQTTNNKPEIAWGGLVMTNSAPRR
jgi:hypothetical protein